MKINKKLYIFSHFYDTREDCYGPCFGNEEDHLNATYYTTYKYDHPIYIPKKEMKDFEKGKIIIQKKKYVWIDDAQKICREEMENSNNKTEKDLINAINKRIKELSTINSPEYKEKQLLNKINELYKKVKGKYIKKETLFNGKFLKVIKETYILPNNKTVYKEKIVKNKGKDSVIVIAKTNDMWPNEKYIITSQQRIKNKIIVEFPSGYIEKNESPIEAAKRELEEEIGYTSNNIKIIDEAYTSPGTDNSKSYIVFAKECHKIDSINTNSTELVSFNTITKNELDYLVVNNIMCGAMNRLAYCNIKMDKPLKEKKLEL